MIFCKFSDRADGGMAGFFQVRQYLTFLKSFQRILSREYPRDMFHNSNFLRRYTMRGINKTVTVGTFVRKKPYGMDSVMRFLVLFLFKN
jgi:hypothetical protein